MKKRRWTGALACAFLLSACGQQAEEEAFSLTKEEQQAYTETINTVMEEFYWDYDKGSLTFSAGTVPEKSEETERLFSASADAGYQLESHVGSSAVVAEASLLHYNGDSAGKIDFYFTAGQLSGLFYRGGYDNGYYSLRERNPFLADGHFGAYENWNGINGGFEEKRGTFPADGYLSQGKDQKGNRLTVSIQNGQAVVMRYANGLSRYRNFSYGTGLEATSAVFLSEEEARMAVLISSITETGEGEGEKVFTRSEKIMLYDENLNPAGEIPLESEFCTALGAENGKLYLFIDQNMEIYEENEGWHSVGKIKLKHNVTQFCISDLDGDGVKEYLMTDGMDLYLYHRSGDTLRKIWSTHLGVENFYGPLCSGDLNRDGVKEVYACDVTGTTIRYILTEQGLQAANEDVAYGQCIYPCDFNGDGLEDYWLVQDNVDRKGILYLGKKQ